MPKALAVSSKHIHALVREEVIDVVREVLSDPDAGLELTQDFIRRLKRSLKNKTAGRTTPLSKVLKQYGV